MPDDLQGLDTNGGSLGGEKFSEKELKFSHWFVVHKVLLKKILTGVLISISGILWIYSIVIFVDWAFISGPQERKNLKTTLQVITHKEALESIKAEQITFASVQVFAGGIGKYDLFTEASNTNKRWRAEFQYRFVGEGYTGDWRDGFILPGETKYITDLGVARAFRPRNVRFESRNIKYARINTHEIKDYSKWEKERLDIEITEKKFNPGIVRNKKRIGKLTFKATNESAFNYWSIGFYALLYRGDQLVSINYLRADKFKAGESRELEMQFAEGLPTISKTVIVPEINIFDDDIYMEQ